MWSYIYLATTCHVDAIILVKHFPKVVFHSLFHMVREKEWLAQSYQVAVHPRQDEKLWFPDPVSSTFNHYFQLTLILHLFSCFFYLKQNDYILNIPLENRSTHYHPHKVKYLTNYGISKEAKWNPNSIRYCVSPKTCFLLFLDAELQNVTYWQISREDTDFRIYSKILFIENCLKLGLIPVGWINSSSLWSV